MRFHFRDCFLWLLMAVTSACAADSEPLVISGPTMGTTYRVKLPAIAASNEARLRAAIEAVLTDVDRRLSTYRQDSEVSRFNRAPVGEWFAVSPATVEVVAEARKIGGQSGGALDVTVGPLVRLWHFGPNAITDTKSTADITPPDAAEVRAARERVGDVKLEVRVDPPALRKQVEGLEVDLSAVGEGDAIDRLAAMFVERGIHKYLIELGGEVRAGGSGPTGRPWRVGVGQPLADRAEVQAVVSLSGAALATSGDYRRFFEHEGQRYSHVIDPTTGQPVEHSLSSVTVAADRCRPADGWATALLVLGPKLGYDCAVEHGIAALLITREANGWTTQATPAWRTRFGTESSD